MRYHPQAMRRWVIVFVIALMLLTARGLFGCPMCKDSVPNSDAQSTAGVPSGFNNTIYLMLASVIGVGGFVAFTLIKGARGSAQSRESSSPPR